LPAMASACDQIPNQVFLVLQATAGYKLRSASPNSA
jgi:hypothetical protein